MVAKVSTLVQVMVFQSSRGQRSNFCFPAPGSIPSAGLYPLCRQATGDCPAPIEGSMNSHAQGSLSRRLSVFQILLLQCALCIVSKILWVRSYHGSLTNEKDVCPLKISSWFTRPLSSNQMPKRRPSLGQRETPAFLSQKEVGDFPTGNATSFLAVC